MLTLIILDLILYFIVFTIGYILGIYILKKDRKKGIKKENNILIKKEEKEEKIRIPKELEGW